VARIHQQHKMRAPAAFLTSGCGNSGIGSDAFFDASDAAIRDHRPSMIAS
jgi:hypothetical protein